MAKGTIGAHFLVSGWVHEGGEKGKEKGMGMKESKEVKEVKKDNGSEAVGDGEHGEPLPVYTERGE